MSPIPTPAQIRAQVAAAWRKSPGARVIGIRAPVSVETGAMIRVQDQPFDVARCASVLELRERLVGREGEERPLVVLTPLEEAELGADVLARFAKRHLFAIQPWQLVKERFRARWVDARLSERHAWAARALLEAEPAEGYPPAASGVIEAEAAWRILFETLAGLPEGRRDPESLLEWTVGGAPPARLSEIDEEIRQGLCQVVTETHGELAGRIFETALGRGDEVVVVGLVAPVLYGDEARGDTVASKAAGKLESKLGDRELGDELARGWAAASEAVIARLLKDGQRAAARRLLDRADALLASLGAVERACRSRFLTAGFEQRLASLAGELEAGVDGRVDLAALWRAGDRVREHVQASEDTARWERVEMALRLSGWLVTQRGVGRPGSLAEAARRYGDEGGFVDWARARVWDGDPSAPLARAYTRLAAAAGELRERQNREFGQLFAGWLATGSHDASVLGVEDFLDRVLVPLGESCPVFLAVIDGMGFAVFRELQADLLRRSWIEIRPRDGGEFPPALAAVPPVSESSRASLFNGVLVRGKQGPEKKGFASHAGLVSCGAPSKPPVLFHKGDLRAEESVGLSPAVRLEELLEAAREAGRAVVLASDHGHVLEHRSEQTGEGGNDRWRPDTGEPVAEGEVLLEGPRVLQGSTGGVIALWSERRRYTAKKNGYHGGAAPQEVVIPLAAFVPNGVEVAGFCETASAEPDWWRRPEAAPAPPAGQQELFPKAVIKPAPETAPSSAGPPSSMPTSSIPGPPEWVEKLLASKELAEQRARAARTHLSDERIRLALAALDERGGKLTRAALARRLDVPELRIGGIVSALRRVLNIEGYAVVSIDEASDTVVLDRPLLETQFGLSAGRKK